MNPARHIPRPHRTLPPRALALAAICACFSASLPAQVATPGVMQGRVVDTRGLALAGAVVYADNTLFYNTNVIGQSGGDGRYSLDVSRPVGTWAASARITRSLNGIAYTLDLDPDTIDIFAGNAGAVRNFSWKIRGPRRDGSGVYGMPVIYYVNDFEDPQYPGEFVDRDFVELTLTPVGALIDGSQGARISGFGRSTPDGQALTDVPIGRYSITARYAPPQHPSRPMLLRVRNTGDYVPALTTDFTELLETVYRIELDAVIDTAYIFDADFESPLLASATQSGGA